MNSFFYHIILNKKAGSNNAGVLWPKLEQILIQNHIQYDLSVSEYHQHSIILAEQISRKFEKIPGNAIIVVGGDGTLHEVLNGLYNRGSQLPIGYVPCGSGNDFARGLKMGRNSEAILKEILTLDETIPVDIGVYQQDGKDGKQVFVNNVGVGFDANIVATTNASKAKRWLNKLHLGTLSYAASIFQVFARQKPFEVRVNVDGEHIQFLKAFLVTTTNHPYFGGGIAIMPTASVFDGKLDLVIVEYPSFFKFIHLFYLVLRGKHVGNPAIHHFISDQIQINSPSVEFGQADGEELGGHSFYLDFTVTQYPFLLKTDSDK